MRHTSYLATSTAFLALLEFAAATYFTSPQTSTVWDTAPGQVITWHYQAGGAAVGDIILQANGLGGAGYVSSPSSLPATCLLICFLCSTSQLDRHGRVPG